MLVPRDRNALGEGNSVTADSHSHPGWLIAEKDAAWFPRLSQRECTVTGLHRQIGFGTIEIRGDHEVTAQSRAVDSRVVDSEVELVASLAFEKGRRPIPEIEHQVQTGSIATWILGCGTRFRRCGGSRHGREKYALRRL